MMDDDMLRDLVWTLPGAVDVSRTPGDLWDLRCGAGRLVIGEDRDDSGHVDGWTWTEFTAAIDDGEWDTVTTDGQPAESWHLVERAVKHWCADNSDTLED